MIAFSLSPCWLTCDSNIHLETHFSTSPWGAVGSSFIYSILAAYSCIYGMLSYNIQWPNEWTQERSGDERDRRVKRMQISRVEKESNSFQNNITVCVYMCMLPVGHCVEMPPLPRPVNSAGQSWGHGSPAECICKPGTQQANCNNCNHSNTNHRTNAHITHTHTAWHHVLVHMLVCKCVS